MTSEFAKFTVPTVKAFLKACSQSVPGNKQQRIAHAFFSCSGDLVVCQETMQRNFSSILHHLSPVIFTNTAVVAFTLLRSSRFNFHCLYAALTWTNAYSEIHPGVAVTTFCNFLCKRLQRTFTERVQRAFTRANWVQVLEISLMAGLEELW